MLIYLLAGPICNSPAKKTLKEKYRLYIKLL